MRFNVLATATASTYGGFLNRQTEGVTRDLTTPSAQSVDLSGLVRAAIHRLNEGRGEEAKLTQLAIAREARVERKSVSGLLAGCPISTDACRSLATYLGLDVEKCLALNEALRKGRQRTPRDEVYQLFTAENKNAFLSWFQTFIDELSKGSFIDPFYNGTFSHRYVDRFSQEVRSVVEAVFHHMQAGEAKSVLFLEWIAALPIQGQKPEVTYHIEGDTYTYEFCILYQSLGFGLFGEKLALPEDFKREIIDILYRLSRHPGPQQIFRFS
ncbi:MAG: hypothetical protein IPJ69_08875 [Deltaproteobacteria bacterium]|nr:MAG: hypothetical protein IPJ69_08875 [Deltaproteobacteria bacterium]